MTLCAESLSWAVRLTEFSSYNLLCHEVITLASLSTGFFASWHFLLYSCDGLSHDL